MEQINLHPLRMIRIALDLTLNQMAEYFEISYSYYYAVEKNSKFMRESTLIKGLSKLDLTLNDYNELEDFKETLMNSDIEKILAYRLMLMKTLSYIVPEEREKTEELIKQCLNKKERVQLNAKKLSPLRVIRILKDLNQSEMAEKLGVETQTVHTIENGKKNIGEKTLSGLLNVDFNSEDYLELEMFRSKLLNLELTEDQSYELMIIKTLSYLIPESKEQFENIISDILTSKKLQKK